MEKEEEANFPYIITLIRPHTNITFVPPTIETVGISKNIPIDYTKLPLDILKIHYIACKNQLAILPAYRDSVHDFNINLSQNILNRYKDHNENLNFTPTNFVIRIEPTHDLKNYFFMRDHVKYNLFIYKITSGEPDFQLGKVYALAMSVRHFRKNVISAIYEENKNVSHSDEEPPPPSQSVPFLYNFLVANIKLNAKNRLIFPHITMSLIFDELNKVKNAINIVKHITKEST
jgi:hypothetical protein